MEPIIYYVRVVAYVFALLAVFVQEHLVSFREFLTVTVQAVQAASGVFVEARRAYGAVFLVHHGVGQAVLQTHQAPINLSLTHIDYLKTVLHVLQQCQAARQQPLQDNFYHIVALTVVSLQLKLQHLLDAQHSLLVHLAVPAAAH